MYNKSISVILPAYNEETRIKESLGLISTYLINNFVDYEILVIDDGSKDNTVDLVNSLNIPNLTVFSLKKNSGKGAAIQMGFLKSKKDLVLFTDSDLATPIEELSKLMSLIYTFDVVIASRNAGDSIRVIKQSIYRQFLGKLFSLFVNIFLGLGVLDSQCGFKLFTKNSAKYVAKKQTIMRFAFDVEQLFIAKKKGFRITEVGVSWFDKKGSKVSPLRDGFKMGFDVLKIWINSLFRKY